MIEMLTVERWLRYDARHPAPTFFARPAWALALAESVAGLEALPIALEVQGVRCIVPAMRSAAHLGQRDVIASPLGAYGCVLLESGGAAAPLLARAAIERIGRAVDALRFITYPLAPQPQPIGASVEHRTTAAIDCRDGFDAVLARMRGVTRRMAGQSERRGVICERAEPGYASVDRYYTLYAAAAQTWGYTRPPIARAVFDALARRAGPDAELWFARADGRDAAGALVLYGASELFVWTTAMDRAAAPLRPTNALHLALLRHACARTIPWYNLGASAGLPGVARFKRDLGAREFAYAEYVLRSPVFALYERASRGLRALVRGGG